MEMGKKQVLGFTVLAGLVLMWLFAGDSNQPAPAVSHTANITEPPERIPGLPYRSQIQGDHGRAGNAYPSSDYATTAPNLGAEYSNPTYGYRFRPDDSLAPTGGSQRYQPYGMAAPNGAEITDQYPYYDSGRPGSYGATTTPDTSQYRFRPYDEDQSRRIQRGGFRPMSAHPETLAEEAQGLFRFPHPS